MRSAWPGPFRFNCFLYIFAITGRNAQSYRGLELRPVAGTYVATRPRHRISPSWEEPAVMSVRSGFLRRIRDTR
jgi:hypothetical protein